MKRPPQQLSTPQRLQIMARAIVDYRTLANAYAGRPMKPRTHERIRLAAKKLKLPAPLPLKQSA